RNQHTFAAPHRWRPLSPWRPSDVLRLDARRLVRTDPLAALTHQVGVTTARAVEQTGQPRGVDVAAVGAARADDFEEGHRGGDSAVRCRLEGVAPGQPRPWMRLSGPVSCYPSVIPTPLGAAPFCEKSLILLERAKGIEPSTLSLGS